MRIRMRAIIVRYPSQICKSGCINEMESKYAENKSADSTFTRQYMNKIKWNVITLILSEPEE